MAHQDAQRQRQPASINTPDVVRILAVMRETAAGLHGVADECTNSEFAIVMNQRAQAMDAASAVVAELIEALHECANADQSMSQMHATERARAALARVGAP